MNSVRLIKYLNCNTMANQVIIMVLVFFKVAYAVEFQIVNKEIGPIWVGIQGNSGQQHLENGGFELKAGQLRSIQSPSNWGGRFWARTWCDYEQKYCMTGDCGKDFECRGKGGEPPASLVEITLKSAGGLDYYDISFVDGYNLAISVEPIKGQSDGSKNSCRPAACKQYLNDDCPQKLRLYHQNQIIGCKSACVATNSDAYCCRGIFGTPETCKSTDWPDNFPKYFKDRCPDAYSYTYDDNKIIFTCKAEKYIITFGV